MFRLSSSIAAFVFIVSIRCTVMAAESIPVVPPEPERASPAADSDMPSAPSVDDRGAEILDLREQIRRKREEIEASRSAGLDEVGGAYRNDLANIDPKDMFETDAEYQSRDAREKSEAALRKAKSQSEINRKFDDLLSEEVEPLFQRVRDLLGGVDVVPLDDIAVHLEKYDPEHGVFFGTLDVDSSLMKTKARIIFPMKREDARAFWKNKDSLIGRILLLMDVHSLDVEIEEFWLEDPQSASRTEERISVIQQRTPTEEQREHANDVRSFAAALAKRVAERSTNPFSHGSADKQEARGWVAEYNRLVEEAKSVFPTDAHIQSLKPLGFHGVYNAQGGVSAAAWGLEAYLDSYQSTEAFKTSASVLAKRVAERSTNPFSHGSADKQEARGWVAEYNRLVEEAKSVFPTDAHIQSLKPLGFHGVYNAQGGVSAAAWGLEAYLDSYQSTEAFKTSASVLAKRVAERSTNPFSHGSADKQEARGWVAEYNRLVEEAKSVFPTDAHIQSLKPLGFHGVRSAQGNVTEAAKTFERVIANVKDSHRQVASATIADAVDAVSPSPSYTSLDHLPYSGRFSPDAIKLTGLLGRWFSPDAKDENGWTDLHYAAALNLPGLASALLDAGADPDSGLERDDEPFGGEVAGTLSAFGKDLSGDDLGDWARNGQRPLHFAAWFNADMVAPHLVVGGSEVDAQSAASRTPLHLAAWENSQAVAEFLIGRGADVQMDSREGWTPLDYAMYRKASGTAALLRRHGGECNRECQ